MNGEIVMHERRYMPDRRLNDNLFDVVSYYVYSKQVLKMHES